MKCPRCVQNVPMGGAESCPHCGYSMAVACGFYGGGSVVAEPLMDVESRLTVDERSGILEIFAGFAAQFPQLFFMMYLGALPPPAGPRQFAFWLLNHAAVQDVDVLLPNERGLLLVVDPQAGSAVLAAGYFLENFVSQAELDAVLRSAQKELGRAAYAGAMQVITTALTGLLIKKAKEAAKHPGAFQPAREPAVAFPPLVRTGEPVMVGAAAPMEPCPTTTTTDSAPALPDEGPAIPTAAVRKSVRRLKTAARRNPPRRS